MRGNYYKIKTKEYFEKRGYQVEYMERYTTIVRKDGKIKRFKRDIFGSDLLLMNKEEIIFVQVKLNRNHIAEAIRKFSQYKFPPFIKRWIVIWEKYKREPEIVEIQT